MKYRPMQSSDDIEEINERCRRLNEEGIPARVVMVARLEVPDQPHPRPSPDWYERTVARIKEWPTLRQARRGLRFQPPPVEADSNLPPGTVGIETPTEAVYVNIGGASGLDDGPPNSIIHYKPSGNVRGARPAPQHVIAAGSVSPRFAFRFTRKDKDGCVDFEVDLIDLQAKP